MKRQKKKTIWKEKQYQKQDKQEEDYEKKETFMRENKQVLWNKRGHFDGELAAPVSVFLARDTDPGQISAVKLAGHNTTELRKVCRL